MNPILLQETFDSQLPILGDECKSILKGINNKYRESKEYTNECIYVGHSQITDYDTGLVSKSFPKIGKSRYLSALNRGRSQGGCDWYFDYIYFIPANSNYSYCKLETLIHQKLNRFKLNKPNHRELYNLSLSDAITKVKEIINDIQI